jgi:RimJ/RimL family protein N-acetyltransferase
MSSPYVLRPIGPGDREALAAAFERLSPESRYRRFLAPKKELTPRELTHLTEVDHVTSEAIVAVEPLSGRLIGVARYAFHPDRPEAADFAVTVADAWQGCGVGTAVSRRLLERARRNGFDVITATTLWENDVARCLLAKLGFHTVGASHGLVELELWLRSAQADSVDRSPWSSVS